MPLEQSLFYELSLVLILATVISLFFKFLRQPLITAYIFTGFLVGPAALALVHSHDAFESFSQIGIVLLLFIIGLGLNASVIRSTGKPAVLTFAAIVAGVGGAGYAVCLMLGMPATEALIIAIALLFSSTIIVVKALTDKKEQSRLYGQIAIGILLVEDIAATVALLFVAASSGTNVTLADFGLLAGKGVLLAGGLALCGLYVLPRVIRLVAGSQELLYIFALAWGFGVASVFWLSGFSIEVGALFAGVALAHLPYAQEISTRLKPLRDFFVVLFFIELGSKFGINSIAAALVPALFFSGLIMVTKPLLIMASLGVLGYTKQTGFKTALHLSQISEFSIVLVVLAQKNGVISPETTAIITLTGLITIILSTYLMNYDNQLYRWLEKPLSIFERSDVRQEVTALEHYPLILIGYHKGGHEYVKTFRHLGKRYVVIDYNPQVIETLSSQHINHLYGDATDVELLDEIGIHKSELIISTIADAETNYAILDHVARRNPEALFICHASGLDEAAKLYDKGASYVLLPQFIGNEHINSFIRRNGDNKQAFSQYRKRHLDQLKNEFGSRPKSA